MAAEEVVQQDKVEEAFVQVEKKRKTMDKKAKKKRKKIIAWSIVGGIVVLIILLIVVISLLSANAPQIVTTEQPKQEQLVSTLTVSGLVESEETATYYAPANLKIGDILISQGEVVKKGEKICAFDEQSLADAMRISELNNIIAENTYKSSVKSYEDNKQKLSTANAKISKYKPLVEAQEDKIKQLEAATSDENAKKAAELNAKIYKAQRDNNEINYVLANAVQFGLSEDSILTYKQYAQSNNTQIMEWQNELTRMNGTFMTNEYNEQQKALTAEKNLLTDYQKELSDAEKDKASAELVIKDEYAAENIKPQGELSTISAARSYEEMQKLTDGIVADKDGIVTSIGGIEGQTIVAGAPMVAIASLDSLKVSFSVSKNELKTLKIGQKAEITIAGNTYEGTITKVSHMATIGSTGAASVQAEAHIDNPDENVYLGLDAKMVITTADIADALQVPVEAVNTDKTGDFVYVIESGVVAKKYVTVGVSSDEMIQILEGITAEDQIITTISAGVEEGAQVTGIPAVVDETAEESIAE